MYRYLFNTPRGLYIISMESIYIYIYIYIYKDKDKDNLLLQTNLIFNNKWLNKIVKLTFEVFGQSK